MIKFKATGFTLEENYGDFKISFDAPASVCELDPDGEYNVSITKYRKGRSLNANSYCWALCERLAKELSKEAYTSNEDIYRDAILKAGVRRIMQCKREDIPELVKDWEYHGDGWQAVPQIDFTDAESVDVWLYVGSSRYNTAEMARLIEHLIDECEGLGISVEDTNYINSLLEAWNEQA